MRKIYVHYAERKEKKKEKGENRNRTHKPRTCPHTKVDQSEGPKRVSISHRNDGRLRSSEGKRSVLEFPGLCLAGPDGHKCLQTFLQPTSEAFAFPLPANIVIAIGLLDVSCTPEPVQNTVPTDEH